MAHLSLFYYFCSLLFFLFIFFWLLRKVSYKNPIGFGSNKGKCKEGRAGCPGQGGRRAGGVAAGLRVGKGPSEADPGGQAQVHRGCGLSQRRLDGAPPTRPQCASFLKDHKVAFTSPL